MNEITVINFSNDVLQLIHNEKKKILIYIENNLFSLKFKIHCN